MASAAFSGVGATFSRGSNRIAEINNIEGPRKTRNTIDVTSLDSTGGYMEFIPGFRDGGSVTLQMNFTRAGYEDLNDDFESEDAVSYTIELSDGTTFTFNGLVTDLGVAVPLNDKVTCSVTIKVSGVIVVGS